MFSSLASWGSLPTVHRVFVLSLNTPENYIYCLWTIQMLVDFASCWHYVSSLDTSWSKRFSRWVDSAVARRKWYPLTRRHVHLYVTPPILKFVYVSWHVVIILLSYPEVEVVLEEETRYLKLKLYLFQTLTVDFVPKSMQTIRTASSQHKVSSYMWLCRNVHYTVAHRCQMSVGNT